MIFAISVLVTEVGAAVPPEIYGAVGPGIERVWDGDEALYSGDRNAAVAAYRDAMLSDDAAAIAMAHLRMLGLSGNLGGLWHGPALDRALSMATGPWGELAWVDYHLLAPVAVGADRGEVVPRAMALLDMLPGPAAARLYRVTGEDSWRLAIEAAELRGGMGEGILASGRRSPPGPGTWFVGVGVSGAPGVGVGGGLTFVHPDLGKTETTLVTSGTITSRGSASGAVYIRSPGRRHARVGVAGWRTVADFYESHGKQVAVTTLNQRGGQISVGPGARWGPSRAWIEGRVRVDDIGAGKEWVAGPVVGVAHDTRTGTRGGRRGSRAGLELESATGSYEIARPTLDLRHFVGFAGGALGVRGVVVVELAEDVPAFRLPSVGGAILHRGAVTGRYRAETMSSLDLEQRWSLGAVLEPVIFANGAWVRDDGWHPGCGVGMRLVLPPEALNIVRVDVAISDSGWGLYAGWGEVF